MKILLILGRNSSRTENRPLSYVDYTISYNGNLYNNSQSTKKHNNSVQAKSVSNYGSATASPNGPKRPKNNRKFNVKKNESPQWKKLKNVKNSKLKTSGKGANQRFYEWDYTHNDIEVYNNTGKHMGSMDPVTGEMYKPPKTGRYIRVP